MQYVQVEMPRF